MSMYKKRRCKNSNIRLKLSNPLFECTCITPTFLGNCLSQLFNILFSSPSLVLEFKTEPISMKNLPAQGLRKQYIEQENNLPLSKGEDAVVLAQASYKCGVRVHPVGLQSVSEANKTIFHFPLSIFHSREVNHAKH